MRYFSGAILIIGLLVSTSLYGDDGKSCWDKAKAQGELDSCAAMDLRAADSEMNAVYKKILKKNAGDSLFIEKLKAAQKAWLAFRDSHLESIYPQAPDREYGSVYPMCFNNIKAGMTVERTKELRQWLDGVPEGDVCSGTIPFSEGKE